MNPAEAYECYNRHSGFYSDKCKNCQYCKTIFHDTYYDHSCDVQLIIGLMYTDLKKCYNTIESYKSTQSEYEEKINKLNERIKELTKLIPPYECCTSSTIESTKRKKNMNKARDYINLIYNVLSKEEVIDLKNKLQNYLKELWESNALSAEYPMNLCSEIIDIINDNIEFDKLLKEVSDKLLEDTREENYNEFIKSYKR